MWIQLNSLKKFFYFLLYFYPSGFKRFPQCYFLFLHEWKKGLTMWWGWGSICGGKWWGGMPGWYPGGICPGGPGGMRPLECGGGGIMPCNAAGWPGGNWPGWGADSAWFRNTWMASSNRSSIRLCCKKNFLKENELKTMINGLQYFLLRLVCELHHTAVVNPIVHHRPNAMNVTSFTV